MEEQDTFALTLDIEELHLLATLLQAPDVVGLRDPFAGLTPEQARQREERAQERLAARGYLDTGPSGSLIVDAALAALVQAPSLAVEAWAASTTGPDGNLRTRLIFRSVGPSVEQEASASGQVTLTAVRDVGALARRTLEFAGLPPAAAAPGPELTLEEDALREARCLALGGDPEACHQLLLATGVPREAARALTGTLSELQSMGSVTVLLRGGQAPAHGDAIAWLAGQQGAWSVRQEATGDTSTMRLLPAATEEIERGLVTMVSEQA